VTASRPLRLLFLYLIGLRFASASERKEKVLLNTHQRIARTFRPPNND